MEGGGGAIVGAGVTGAGGRVGATAIVGAAVGAAVGSALGAAVASGLGDAAASAEGDGAKGGAGDGAALDEGFGPPVAPPGVGLGSPPGPTRNVGAAIRGAG